MGVVFNGEHVGLQNRKSGFESLRPCHTLPNRDEIAGLLISAVRTNLAFQLNLVLRLNGTKHRLSTCLEGRMSVPRPHRSLT